MSFQSAPDSNSKLRIMLLMLVISVATAVAYSQVIQCGFVSFDDPVDIINNYNIKNGITLESIRWAFTAVTDGNGFPLTWLSYMLDISIAGEHAQELHVINLLYHLLNSSLLFVILFKLTGHINRSAFVAALFALHPLHVESVAWISERKDLLSTLFLFLTIISYAKYKDSRSVFSYFMTLILFVCGLMSKSMLVTVPLLLLLLDFWPLNRTASVTGKEFRKLLLEKIPFFLFSLMSGVITFNALKHKAVISFVESTLLANVKNALISYTMYLYKTFIPTKLSILYPFEPEIGSAKVLFAVLVLTVVSTGAIMLKKEKPYLFVGWFWYLISLLPVIGLIRVGNQSMADRYTYIPLIGIFIVLVWGISEIKLVQKIGGNVKAVMTIAVFSVLSVLTWNQVGYWKDSISLFGNAVEVTENNWFALGVLGLEYSNRNELDKAFALLSTSLSLNPKNAMSLYNMGVLQNKMGNRTQALHYFQKTVAIEPDYPMSHYQIGVNLLFSGDIAGALNEYRYLKVYDSGLSQQLLSAIMIQNKAAISSQ